MTVSDPAVVDAIGVDRDDGCLVLSVADDLSWSDAEAHVEALARKVQAYAGFIANGELERRFPESVGRDVRIDVVFREPPPEAAVVALDGVERALEAAGIGFTHRTVPVGRRRREDE